MQTFTCHQLLHFEDRNKNYSYQVAQSEVGGLDFEKSTVQANLVERQSSETVLRSVQGRKQEALKLFAVSKRILFALLFGILLLLLAG